MTRRSLLLCLALAGCASRPALPPPSTPLTATPAAVARPAPEAERAPHAPNLPAVHEITLDNGLRVLVAERRAFPHLSLALVTLRGGEDGRELESSGLASVIAEIVAVGSVAAPDDSPAPKRDAKGADGSAPPPNDERPLVFVSSMKLPHASGLSVDVDSSQLAQAMQSIASSVLEPELDDTALTRARRAVASELSDLRDNAYGVAVNHMMQRLYGPSHVLGQHAKLAMQRADKHDLAAVRGGYRARFVPAASVLIVAGDVRAEEVEAQTRALFGAWKNVAEAPLTYEPPTWVPRGKRNVCLHMADSRQAVIVVGQKAPAPNAVDYEALRALVHILGGSASSRLTRALRDEQGATYHVGARLAPRRDGSTLLIETSTVNDAAPEALARIRKELGRLRTEPVTRDELRRAQHALLDELGSSVASASGAVHTLASMLSMGQWHGDLQKQVQAILALDEARLLAAAKAHLTPEAPAILVGDMDGYGKLGQWAYADNEMLPE